MADRSKAFIFVSFRLTIRNVNNVSGEDLKETLKVLD